MPDPARHEVKAPFAATVIAIARDRDEPVNPGEALIVLEAMKMEHEIVAESPGVVQEVIVAVGQTVEEGELLAILQTNGAAAASDDRRTTRAEAEERQDLQAVVDRHALGLDEARPEAVAKRHEQEHRTARENLADLVDPGTYVEYGPLICL
jgi:pyruvate/2-oxoglutarate dehydrogenase complex dihydrolipoamide acyltransferase (E2) component